MLEYAALGLFHEFFIEHISKYFPDKVIKYFKLFYEQQDFRRTQDKIYASNDELFILNWRCCWWSCYGWFCVCKVWPLDARDLIASHISWRILRDLYIDDTELHMAIYSHLKEMPCHSRKLESWWIVEKNPSFPKLAVIPIVLMSTGSPLVYNKIKKSLIVQ